MENLIEGLIVFILFYLLLGGLSFDYCLWSIFGKNIPWYADVICGIFTAEVTIPGMIVCFILRMFGIEAPFIQ